MEPQILTIDAIIAQLKNQISAHDTMKMKGQGALELAESIKRDGYTLIKPEPEVTEAPTKPDKATK
jgi:hypothetical protein